MKVSDDKISESPGMSRLAGKVSLSVSKPFAEHVRLPGLSRPTLELSLLVGCQGLMQGCGGPACYYFAFQSVRMCSEDADIHDALQLYTQNPHSKTVRLHDVSRSGEHPRGTAVRREDPCLHMGSFRRGLLFEGRPAVSRATLSSQSES